MSNEGERRRDNERRKREEAEGQPISQTLPYPKSVFFIIGNEFCERFSYYGMKTILSLYLKKKLHYEESRATVIYHTFSLFCYFTPIFGAMLADMLLGKFRTIVSISVIYVLGHLLKTLAAIPTLGVPPIEFSMIGLALIAIGTGGIKPCVAAFGGDQFKLPEQTRQLQTFFSVFYFAINAGSLISTIITPIIREDVECFGDDTCYSLPFGIPAILMFIATVIIIIGKPLYKMKPPQGNILPRVFGTIFYALRKKFLKREKAEHWLDLAKPKYEDRLVEDVKCLLRVLVLYLPLPIWWALYDQTGSRWTFQATRMDGQLGSTTIKPDQMQVVNPVLVLFLIPIFDRIIYPVFAKCGLLVKPLQRMTVGGLLTASSFFISGFLELRMMETYAKIPAAGLSHVYVMNSLPCTVDVELTMNGSVTEFSVPELSSIVQYEVVPGNYSVNFNVNDTCLPDILNIRTVDTEFTTYDETVSSLLLSLKGDSIFPVALRLPEDAEKDKDSKGRVRFVTRESLIKLNGSKVYNFTVDEGFQQSEFRSVEIGDYRVLADYAGEEEEEEEDVSEIHVKQGGVYTVLAVKDPETGLLKTIQFTLTVPNSIHILWLVPQYFVITVGEIMFSITGLEFSYSQAPESMKSVLQAAWLLTVAFGNLIVIVVAEAKSLTQDKEFFMFACLMIVDMVVFAGLAWMYVPRDMREKEEKEDMKMEPLKPAESTGVINDNFNHDD